MFKRMIVVKKHEWLENAATSRSFSSAKDELEKSLKPKGFSFDANFAPVELKGGPSIIEKKPEALGFNYRDQNNAEEERVYIVRADFENEESVRSLIQENPTEVEGVYADCEIFVPEPPIELEEKSMSEKSMAGAYCGGTAVDDFNIVAEKLKVNQMNLTGKNVRIAIVDTGIKSDSHIKVQRGWVPPGVNTNPGQFPRGHGTMCAFDALIAAPDAELLDYALLTSRAPNGWIGFLSDAVAAYASLIREFQNQPGPLVVNNSWGMFDLRQDAPIGDPANYSSNPKHPFTQIVHTLVDLGADVLFAAGNCGKNCPDRRCGPNNTGPGASIHGANGSPNVITVGAITTDNRRLGYSSQGPAGLARLKPDILGYSHFKGSGVYPADGGTSAACPVAAGVVAALREKFRSVSDPSWDPHVLKAQIQRTATPVDRLGFSYDYGYGIINGVGVLNGF
jgi:subtilisin family serine protease